MEHRIKKLEGVLPNREFMSMVLGVLREIGYEELSQIAAQMGVGVPRFLLLSVDDTVVISLVVVDRDRLAHQPRGAG